VVDYTSFIFILKVKKVNHTMLMDISLSEGSSDRR